MAGLGKVTRPLGLLFHHKGSLDAISFMQKIEEKFGKDIIKGFRRWQEDPSKIEITMKTEVLKNVLLQNKFEYKGTVYQGERLPDDFMPVCIRGLPHEIEDRDVAEFLSFYGEVGHMRRLKFKGTEWLNGDRMIQIKMKIAIPNFIVIRHEKAQALYFGVRKQCLKCRSTEHLVAECPRNACFNCGSQKHRQIHCDGICKKCNVTHKGRCQNRLQEFETENDKEPESNNMELENNLEKLPERIEDLTFDLNASKITEVASFVEPLPPGQVKETTISENMPPTAIVNEISNNMQNMETVNQNDKTKTKSTSLNKHKMPAYITKDNKLTTKGKRKKSLTDEAGPSKKYNHDELDSDLEY
jgi:hypothetical protein